MHRKAPAKITRPSAVSAIAITVVWLAACAGSLLLSGAEPEALVWPTLAGALAAAVGARVPRAGRVLTLATLIPAAVGGADVLPWFAAAAAVTLLAGSSRTDRRPSLGALHRHLMQCRRRGESATVLALELPSDGAGRLDALLDAARVTDSFVVAHTAHGFEVLGVLEGDEIDPELVEQRFRSILGGAEPAFGWARFPEDGVSLEVLVEHARASLARSPEGHRLNRSGERSPGAARPVLIRRIANASRSRAADGAAPLIPDAAPKLAAGSRVLVTGAAGFIGSHLCERLVADGYDVIGVDCFTDFYSRATKDRNLTRLWELSRFSFRRLDLSRDELAGLLDGVDAVFHLAGQAGVRTSFGASLESYLRHNVLATQRLLEEAIDKPLDAFVYASSSSVYGNPRSYPTTEETPRRPVSPYGMTKVATEEITGVYHRSFGIPVVGLRYFTAYGPRQRPDMAFSKFLRSALAREPIDVMGDGRQVRDFTFVDDIVEGTIVGARHGRPGSVYNIGGGRPVELREAVEMIAELVGRPIELRRYPAQVGDVRMTGCDGGLARKELGYAATTSLRVGLVAHFDWMVRERSESVAVTAP